MPRSPLPPRHAPDPNAPDPNATARRGARRRLATGGSAALAVALIAAPLALGSPAGADDDKLPPIAVEPPVGHEHSGEGMLPRQMRTSRAPATPYEMPFPCGQDWTGTTRSYHSPSPLSIDWNRTDDAGDPVVAAADGKVMVADSVDNGGYGKWVQIGHSGTESTLYAHLNGVDVRAEQQVKRGDVIGYVGTSGNSTGTHLHFEQRQGSSVRTPFFHGVEFEFGSTLKSKNCATEEEPEQPAIVTDPVAGNLDGTAAAEAAFYRRGPIHRFVVLRADGTKLRKPLGTTGDQPVLGDWNGNGVDNAGVRTPATSTFSLKVGSNVETVAFGVPGDLPVAGDWDGDGTDEIGVRKVSKPKFRLRAADGTVRGLQLGKVGDLPVTGDWNGDAVTDVGVYDQAARTFTLRVLAADPAGDVPSDVTVRFGATGDLPVVGDWDGNGTTDLGSWNPGTAILTKRLAPSPSAPATGREKVEVGYPRE